MPQIIVTRSFQFAHAGVTVEAFDECADARDTTDEVAAWVCEHGFGRLVEAEVEAKAEPASARSRKAVKAAPENKSSGN